MEASLTSKRLSWESTMSFGKHKGKMLLVVLATDKPWLRWAWENELHTAHPEIAFIFENVTPVEMKRILTSK